MIINKHSKLILMIAIMLTINQKIYSAEQQEVRQPDAEITATDSRTSSLSLSAPPATSSIVNNAATYSLIPDYGRNINSMAVAELNRYLQVHGYYEFAPATYADITRQTQKHGMPADVSFSRETQRATVTWNRDGLFCCFHGREKIKIFETIPIAAVNELNIAKPSIPSKRPSTTLLVQPVSAHQQAACLLTERSVFEPSAVLVVTPKPSTTSLASTQQQVAPTQRSTPQPPPAYVAPKPQTHFPPASQIVYPKQQTSSLFLPSNAQQQQGGITEQAAHLALYSEFNKLTEIRANHYLAPDQSNQIISDLMKFGQAIKFEPRINDQGALFFVITWNDGFEKFYKITKRT